MNQKGGVAKTTLARLASEYFARQGWRVLGIDSDPQANYSCRYLHMQRRADTLGIIPPRHPDFDPADTFWKSFSAPPPGYWSSAHLYTFGYAIPYPTAIKKLHIIPAHTHDIEDLLLKIEYSRIQAHVVPHLANIFADAYFTERFDLVIIDTPPQTSPLNQSVLRAASHLLIPTEMHENALSGLMSAAAAWRVENHSRSTDNPLRLAGVVPTRYNPASSEHVRRLAALNQTEGVAPYLLPPMRQFLTYQNTSVSRDQQKSLFDLHKKNLCRADALRLFRALAKRLG